MSEENTEVSAGAESAPNDTQQEAPVELTVNDLSAIRQVIDAAQSRGAFKANEMVAVGTVYTKLDNFLNAVAAQQQPAEAAEQTDGE